MPIIIDNFHVNTNVPIDNRFVVGGTDSFYSNRDAIQYKYQGLRIWDLTPNNSGPYYWTGVTWSSENAVGVAVDGTTLPGYLPVFTQGPTVLGKSIIYQNPASNQIGIGLVGNSISANVPSGPSLANGLHVAGNIRTNASFVGSGLHVTDINASNINSGLLAVTRISHLSIFGTLAPNEEYVLFNDGTSGSVRWRAASGLSVLNSTNTTNINISENSSSSFHYITFVNATSGQLPLRINSSKMQFKPDNGQLFLSDGSASAPVYSFLNSNGGTNTGMYYDGYNINFSKQGNNFVSIVDNGIAVKSSQYPQIQFINTTTGKNRLLWVDNNDNLLFRLDAGQLSTEKRVWHQDNLFTLKNSGNLPIETGRNTNSQSTDANGAIIKGIYTHNVYNTPITPSTQVHWSVISFGKGDEGSVQLASNWYGNNTQNGVVYADRDILLRSLRDTIDSWSPWVKIWNSGNSGYVPFGAIMMWSGSATLLPTGWRLCDGSAAVTIPAGSVPGQPGMTSITIPDLRERFVVGAGDNEDIISYNYNQFTLNASLPFFNGTTTTNKSIARVFTRVNTWSFVSGNVYNYSGQGSNSPNPETQNLYALYISEQTTAANSYFLVYNLSTKNYRLYNNLLQTGNGVTLVPGSFPYWDPPQGSLAQLSQVDDLVTYRPNFSQLIWQKSNTGYNVGDKGGFNYVKLHTSEIPSHNHSAQLRPENGLGTWAGGNPNSTTNDGTPVTDNTGGDFPHENRPPYYALAFIIYTGI